MISLTGDDELDRNRAAVLAHDRSEPPEPPIGAAAATAASMQNQHIADAVSGAARWMYLEVPEGVMAKLTPFEQYVVVETLSQVPNYSRVRPPTLPLTTPPHPGSTGRRGHELLLQGANSSKPGCVCLAARLPISLWRRAEARVSSRAVEPWTVCQRAHAFLRDSETLTLGDSHPRTQSDKGSEIAGESLNY